VLSSLPSIHRGSIRVDRRMSPSHGSDEAYGGFGARSRRRLQVPKP
jgi:hypothetical protein